MATAADNKKITQAVEETLEYIKTNAPEEFSKINADPKVRDAITEAARSAAAEQVKLAHEFASRPDQDIRKRLAKHLPDDRIKLIEEALCIPTFCMEITPKRDGKHQVQLTRGGEEFLPRRELGTAADIDWAKLKQYASIIVEAVMLVIQAVGIKASVSRRTMELTIEEVVVAIKNSAALRKTIDTFISSWTKAGSAISKAKAIFYLLKDLKAANILWTIIKSLCKEMSWLDWVKTSAQLTALIILAIASDGAALIAEIALALVAAVDFAQKIANLVKLEEIKQTL
ncbi:hypothetical protein OS493_020036 [Desmophyllum pertusum]|uniref:Uncharacterized protein n=1 Tax=Desmophyllum pertusum TaxID=174260 RepID=A0A9W9YEW3_9CNID|nr:hypothetical protein OS493_020036 [Desmophyllum pertusum]